MIGQMSEHAPSDAGGNSRHVTTSAPARIAVATLIVLGAVIVAFAGGVVAQLSPGLGPIAGSAVLAAVIAIVFAVRPAEGLATFLIVVLLAESVEYWTGASLRLADEAGLAALLLTAVVLYRQRICRPGVGIAEAGLAVLLVAAVASTIVAEVPARVALPGMALLAKGFAFFYLVSSLRLGGGDLRRVTAPIFVVAMMIALVGLLQLVARDLADELLRLPSSGRPRGGVDLIGSVFTHPALFGWLMAFVAMFLYARFAVIHAAWSLALAVVLTGGALLSGRHTPVIGLVVGLVTGAARQATAGGVHLRVWAVVGAILVTVLFASVSLLGDFYRSTLDRYGAQPDVLAEVFSAHPDAEVVQDLHPRVALYAGSLAVARDAFPLGGGVGRYASHMSRETYSPLYEAYGLHRVYGLRQQNPIAVTDTFWPMILGETGALGLLGAVLFFGGIVVRLWRAAERIGNPEAHVFALGALVVFAETLVRSLVSPAFVAPPIAYFSFGAAGLTLAARRRRPTPAEDTGAN